MKKEIVKIILSFTFLLLAIFIPWKIETIKIGFFIISYLIIGYNIILKAIQNVIRGKMLDENCLMTIATLGAFFIREFPEAIAVMLFYQIGEMFQDYAVDKSRKSIANLMDIRPDYANVDRNKKIVQVNPEAVKIGEIIIVKPGEKIPLDGKIIEGDSLINTKALTGESLPKHVKMQDEVLSGSINEEGVLKIQVEKEYKESTVSQILNLVENASDKKSHSENFISKFAKYYTPIVVFAAILLALVPPMIFPNTQFIDWIYRALSFLVISCPCALVVSIPLSFFGGLGASSKHGILIKGSNYLEAIEKAEILVCDKTGTLTEGVCEVQEIHSLDCSKEELLKYAALTEYYSNHPIAQSIKKSYKKELKEKDIKETKELAGMGVIAKIENHEILVGNEKLMQKYHVKWEAQKNIGTNIYIAIDNKYAGFITIADKIKEDSYKAIEKLKKNHIKKVVMLTGDHEDISKNVANELKLDEYHAELLPQNKVEWVEKLMQQKSKVGKLIFVGDGINDAPVLALSDIGIAMGLGSDAAIESSDIVLMTNEISKIADAMKISKKTMKIVKENIIFAISIKIGILILSALGIVSMWAAVFADVGVSVIAILNALRVLNIK